MTLDENDSESFAEGLETDEGNQDENVEDEEENSGVAGGSQEFCLETLEELIEKNTDSFTCLAQLLLSRSSLLRHPLYHFPPLEDPGIDEAFDYEEPPVQLDWVGVDKYRATCKELNIVPISRVINSLATEVMDLRYYGLTPKQFKSIFGALERNLYVRELDLEENFLEVESATLLGDMLRENCALEVLHLRLCNLGPEGAREIQDGVMTTQTLQYLDVSSNNLGAEGLKYLTDALRENYTVKTLNLNKNDLDEFAVPHLCKLLTENSDLQVIDLSWNRINTPAAWKQFATEGLMNNKYITSLNLSWNGINSKMALKFLLKFTKETETLEYLDLSNNRICGELVRMVKALVMKNTSLIGLNIGFNPLTPDDAAMMIGLLLLPKASRPKLDILEMDNIYVKKGTLPNLRRARRLNKTVTIGGVLGDWTIKGPDTTKLAFDRCRLLAMKPKKKKAKKDFGHFIFSLPDKPMRKNDFSDAAKKFKMKAVDKDLIDELMTKFKYKKSGVDCVAMREKYLEYYPDAEPPPKKQKKKKGKGRKGKKGKKKDGEESGPESTAGTSTTGETLPSTIQGGITTEETSTIQAATVSEGEESSAYETEVEGESEGEAEGEEDEDFEEDGEEVMDYDSQPAEGLWVQREVAYAEEVPQVLMVIGKSSAIDTVASADRIGLDEGESGEQEPGEQEPGENETGDQEIGPGNSGSKILETTVSGMQSFLPPDMAGTGFEPLDTIAEEPSDQ